MSPRLRQRRSRLLGAGTLAFVASLLADQAGPASGREILSRALMLEAACSFGMFVLLEVRRALHPRPTASPAKPTQSRQHYQHPRPTHLTAIVARSDRSTERRPVSPIPFISHECGADFTLTTRALALVDYELDCPQCGSPAVQADLLYPSGQGPRLIEQPEAEAS